MWRNSTIRRTSQTATGKLTSQSTITKSFRSESTAINFTLTFTNAKRNWERRLSSHTTTTTITQVQTGAQADNNNRSNNRHSLCPAHSKRIRTNTSSHSPARAANSSNSTHNNSSSTWDDTKRDKKVGRQVDLVYIRAVCTHPLSRLRHPFDYTY
jgi:hypothetical protein